MKYFRKESLWALLPVIGWFICYYLRLPATVQSGDSGEFVTASELLTVPHPPGYPLLIWYLKLGRSFFSIGTPFWQAAFLNSLLSLLSLSLLFFLSPKNRIMSSIAMVSLALSSVFWKFSLLPDAFALHWLIQIAILFVFLSSNFKTETSRFGWMSVLIGLGLANHQTTVFLAPLWLFQAWKVRNPRQILRFLGIGATITGSFYLSLLFFNRSHYLSWGFIENLHGVFRHFLRSDYGTFSLSASHQQPFYWEYLRLFGKHLFQEFRLFLLLLLLIGIGKVIQYKGLAFLRLADKKLLAVLCCLILYIGPFFAMFNVGPFGFGYDVFEKFMGMPLILFLTIGALSISDQEIFKFLANFLKISKPATFLIWVGLILISASSNWFTNANRMDYRSRVFIEEAALNLVQRPSPDSSKKTFVTAMSDTSLFSLHYVLGVLGANPNVSVVSPVGFETFWNRKSLLHNFANLKFSPTKSGRYFMEDFIRDNAKYYNFLVEQDINGNDFALEFHRIGRFVSNGQGISFRNPKESQITRSTDWSEIPVSNYLLYDPDLEAYSRYSHYYLARGLIAYQNRNLQQAIIEFDNGLLEVPFCQPCLENKCKILEELKELNGAYSCKMLLDRVSANYFNYYGFEN